MNDFMRTIVQVILVFSTSVAFSLTKDQSAKVENAVLKRESDPQNLKATIALLENLSKKDSEIYGQISRLYFFDAINEEKKDSRIKIYQKSIDAADKAIQEDSKSVLAHFWKAAAVGKQGLDIGVTKALKSARPMRESLEIVLGNDEKFEYGGAHRALGRLYYELPGWPLSFGDNDKALEHLKKSMNLFPDHLGNRIYYAQMLLKKGQKEEAKKQIVYFRQNSKKLQFKKELEEYNEIADKLEKKL